MSLTATRQRKTKSAIATQIERHLAAQDIQDYLSGQYVDPSPAPPTQEQLTYRHMLRWMRNRQDQMFRFGLAGVRYRNIGTQDDPIYNGAEYTHFFVKSLACLGIDTPSKGNRFLDFYAEVVEPSRSWVSGCQVDHKRVVKICLTPNYNRLPDWVRQGLMTAPHSAKIGGDRIGNVWRLIPCVKAWKWAPFPKRVAEKIGKRSPRFRMLAAIAWTAAPDYEGTNVEAFWGLLAWLQSCSLMEVVEFGIKHVSWGRTRWGAFLTESLGLPWGLIELPKEVTAEAITEAITTYGSPREACLALFGVSGKATERAFQSATKDAWQWASVLAYGNPDAVQKVLGMETIIGWEPDAVDFLKSLPMVSRLRMLQATEFKYRGEVCPISPDHVRDTGYLWSNMDCPSLGRVRCWFSVHETLAAAFVEQQPDEALPISSDWARLDGLCAVDGSWEIELPRRVATLKYYGQTLRNCVGGYGPAIKAGRSVIFVVRERGQLTHCAEVSGGAFRQFYRSGNSSPDHSIYNLVERALSQAGVIS